MLKIYIKPVAGRSVRDPNTLEVIKPEGEYKPRDGYWLKRVKDGDCVIAKAPPAPVEAVELTKDDETKKRGKA